MAADPRNTGPQTYISSLITPDDKKADGLTKTSDGPLFVGNVAIKSAIIFPDGTAQTSAGGSSAPLSGPFADMPYPLPIAVMYLATDKNVLYIGTAGGPMPVGGNVDIGTF
jgi:hypothetical protein